VEAVAFSKRAKTRRALGLFQAYRDKLHGGQAFSGR
jgi:hypothetical protein